MSGVFSQHQLGHIFEDDRVTVFFGDRRSLREALTSAFPAYRLLGIKQTHSDIVIESPYIEPGPEADAHITRDRGLAICVRTADCIPVMIHDPSSGWIASIHAGWRGVENEIILKTGHRLMEDGASLSSARAWIGPHIGAESFEVGVDVGEKLEARFQAVRAFASSDTSLRAHQDPTKTRVDLLSIAKAQLASLGIPTAATSALFVDTFKSQAHESFRRDRERAGRQTSFIALKG